MTASGPAAPATWTVTVTVPDAALAAVEAALAPCCDAVASFEAPGAGGGWRVTGYAAAEPDRAALDRRLALAAAAAGCALPAPALARLPATDWLAENRRSFRPVAAGRYRVVPRDDGDGDGGRESAGSGAGMIVIRLNAGPAFGSGSHESTRGCLIALDRLARRRVPRRILDLGTGSGILAIAAARTWPAPVIAADVDPVAAATARANARANGVAARIDARAGPGLRPVARAGRFDLIVANIQARPLLALAPAIRGHATADAIVVLSGLLARQAPAVLAGYRMQGLTLADRVRLGDWATLILRRRVRSPI